MEKKFTVGYIEHNEDVFARLLGPSLDNLKGDFDVVKKSDRNFPAENYNSIICDSKTPYIILTHQDVTFSPNLLERISSTIDFLKDDFGAIGMVGVDSERNYRWSTEGNIYELDTLDCCFLVVKKDSPVKFDELTFNDFHLYVEDYCAQQKKLGKKIYTIDIFSREDDPQKKYQLEENSFLNHHSFTLSKLGPAWGRYMEFRRILEEKWPGIKTT
jgi:hypothetical protein